MAGSRTLVESAVSGGMGLHCVQRAQISFSVSDCARARFPVPPARHPAHVQDVGQVRQEALGGEEAGDGVTVRGQDCPHAADHRAFPGAPTLSFLLRVALLGAGAGGHEQRNMVTVTEGWAGGSDAVGPGCSGQMLS